MKDKNQTIQHEKLYSMLLKYYQKIDDNIDENSFINDKKRYLMTIINKIIIGVIQLKKFYFL